jgi:hypothetical protein
MTTKTSKPNDAPMAVTSDGSVLVNVMQLDVGCDPTEAVRVLLKLHHEVFVGVVVRKGHRRTLMRDVDDALADVVGRLGPRLRRRRAPRR